MEKKEHQYIFEISWKKLDRDVQMHEGIPENLI